MRRGVGYLLLLMVAFAACGERADRFTGWDGVDGPFVVGRQVVYLDHNADELVVLEPAAGDTSPAWKRLPVTPGSQVVAVLESSGQVLLQARSEGLLEALDPETGDSVVHDLDAPYDQFALVQDPPFLTAFYSDNGGTGGGALFTKQGEVAFVDLSKAEEAVRKVLLKTYGGAPVGVDVAPRVPAAGGGRLFAFVRWNSYVTVLDMEDPDAGVTSIALTPADSNLQVVPGPMQFVVTDGHLRALFLVSGSNDLFAVDVEPDLVDGEGGGVNLKLFPTAPGANTFTTYNRADGSVGALVLSPSARRLAVVTPDTSEVSLYELEGLSPTRLHVFSMVSPETGVEEEFAFIYNDGGSVRTYYFVELHRLAEKKSKALHRFSTLPAGVRKVRMLDTDTALVFHNSATTPMSLVTISDGSVISVGGSSISGEVFSPDGQTLYALATQSGRTWLVAFAVGDFSSRELDVTHGTQPDQLLQMPDSGLLLLAGDNPETLVVVPEDFQTDALDTVVEFLVPFLYGLE